MTQPDIITRQREIVRRFWEAEALRGQAESRWVEGRQAAESAARERRSLKETETQDEMTKVRTILEEAAQKVHLPQATPYDGGTSQIDPALALRANVALVEDRLRDVKQAVSELEGRRAHKRAAHSSRIGFAVVVAIGITCTVGVGGALALKAADDARHLQSTRQAHAERAQPSETRLPTQPAIAGLAASSNETPNSLNTSTPLPAQTISATYTARIYNVADQAKLYINGQLEFVAQWGYSGVQPAWRYLAHPRGDSTITSEWEYVGHGPGDTGTFDITHVLNPGTNTLRLELWAKTESEYMGSRECLSSVSLEVNSDDRVILTESIDRRETCSSYTQTYVIDVH